jgi:nicotinamidase-related amidase
MQKHRRAAGLAILNLVCCFLLQPFSAVVAEDKGSGDGATLKLTLRSRVEAFKGSGVWDEVSFGKAINPKETAIIICDMWDKHWCESATKRCAALARKIDPVLKSARAQGMLVIHAPSETMDFYKDAPQRKRILEMPRATPPKTIELPTEPALPIDDSDGGCDDAEATKFFKAWSRQHEAITIGEMDLISDNGAEVYSALQKHGVKNLLVMGVHTNMCVLGRSFAIRQMTKWGVRCILVRDLTDAMYNPRKAPFVSHAEGTELVIQHIEKYWCPSITSDQLSAK